jgi:hypothetical protein
MGLGGVDYVADQRCHSSHMEKPHTLRERLSRLSRVPLVIPKLCFVFLCFFFLAGKIGRPGYRLPKLEPWQIESLGHYIITLF